MDDKLEGMVVLGIKNNKGFLEYLTKEDPCFGKLYTTSSRKCSRCRAPVLLDGSVSLLNEVCKSLTQEDATPVKVRNLTSKKVLEKIQAGFSPTEIVHYMVGEDVSYRAILEARKILARRISHLKHNKGMPMPDIPTAKEMLDGEEEESI